jgi:hypothetical protein
MRLMKYHSRKFVLSIAFAVLIALTYTAVSLAQVSVCNCFYYVPLVVR